MNVAKGKVTAADGTRWRVRGHADFDLHEDGYPLGDPADFQGLTVEEF